MIANLPPGLYASVESHNKQIWLSIHSGGSAVLPMTAEQAEEIGLALFRAGRTLKRSISTT